MKKSSHNINHESSISNVVNTLNEIGRTFWYIAHALPKTHANVTPEIQQFAQSLHDYGFQVKNLYTILSVIGTLNPEKFTELNITSNLFSSLQQELKNLEELMERGCTDENVWKRIIRRIRNLHSDYILIPLTYLEDAYKA